MNKVCFPGRDLSCATCHAIGMQISACFSMPTVKRKFLESCGVLNCSAKVYRYGLFVYRPFAAAPFQKVQK